MIVVIVLISTLLVSVPAPPVVIGSIEACRTGSIFWVLRPTFSFSRFPLFIAESGTSSFSNGVCAICFSLSGYTLRFVCYTSFDFREPSSISTSNASTRACSSFSAPPSSLPVGVSPTFTFVVAVSFNSSLTAELTFEVIAVLTGSRMSIRIRRFTACCAAASFIDQLEGFVTIGRPLFDWLRLSFPYSFKSIEVVRVSCESFCFACACSVLLVTPSFFRISS